MFRHILVPLDGSPLAECVLPHALEIARAFTARLTVLQVLECPSSRDGTPAVDPLDWHLTKAESEAYLDGVAERLRDHGADVRKACLEGRPAERVIEFAHRSGVDLIALSSHGQSGLSGWNVSSVVQKIILRAHVSILLVRAYELVSKRLADLRYRRLMVTLDGSHRAECVLPSATGLARHHKAEVLLTHVVRRPEMPRRAPLSAEDVELTNRVVQRNTSEATRYLEHLHARLSPDISEIRPCMLVAQNASIALHELVETQSVDLVIISAHGHSGGSRWPYGSVAVSFIVYGNTPLLIVQDLAPDELEKNRPEQVLQELKGH
ncbi:MAG: universal stress protein [Thermoanaerobaculales bacterium]|nr:universal stress protein [Thermoanaerobaculales bacterium]